MSLDDPKLHEALAVEAERVGCIDVDVLRAFPEEIASATLDASGAPDIGTVVAAIRKIKEKSPRLFRTQDFEQMDEASYTEAETRIKKSYGAGPSLPHVITISRTWTAHFSPMRRPEPYVGTSAEVETALTGPCFSAH